jgi:hypothetical protein
MRFIKRWLRDASRECSMSECLAEDINDALEDLLRRYPHDHVIAALFSGMRARCSSPQTFFDVADCASQAFGLHV